MLTIRFNRVGKKNQVSFRIALQEKTQAPGKRHIEMLGSYDPHKKGSVLKKERILHWMSLGAQLSDSVYNLLVREGVVSAEKKRVVKMKRPEVKPGEAVASEEAVEASAAATPEESALAKV
ncbi:MAG: 30S ribosomal protein S16 [Candidatus Moranbacteria bacterium]|jgi:small subunit ribosomal protein S16|nr:30S ribosomal protein S16 [Candidatus Moranbacteria bacterium]MBP9801755.1 30S ribosomal protein S16 [Candidatus Moranbacteria bacterium]